MKTAEDFLNQKLGNVIYTSIFYDKLKKRVIEPLKHQDFAVLMASFDASASHADIIMNKICCQSYKKMDMKYI
jgi:hypothetical protein